MGIHRVHGEEINFHSNTDDARHWLEYVISREGLKAFSDRAKSEGRFNFHDDLHETKFKLEYDKEEESFDVRKRE